MYARQKEYERAMQDYAEVIAINPKSSLGYNNLAWRLATCPKESVRDGKKAVEYATKACELFDWKNPIGLRTLAAASAEAGDFEAAVKWEKKSLALLFGDREPPAAAKVRLKQYEDGKPIREE